LYTADVSHGQAVVGGHYWPGQPDGCDYVARLRWDEPAVPVSIRVRATLPDGELVIRGVSLIDERTGGFQSLVISDQGSYRLVHSGDVKIYENMDVLPRAFVVHSTSIADDETALTLMRAPDFDPAVHAVLADESPNVSNTSVSASSTDTVRIVQDEPELIRIVVDAPWPGYLVLTDAWYPGWRATVDGEAVVVARADILFRAVPVGKGIHQVTFFYQPASFCLGVTISLVMIVALLLVSVAGWRSFNWGHPTR
ncbi:MAG: YfhO family protein, partial [Anaerolineae bacterium]|nr:YfhO family protein [Anaerolineae bacterium]